MNLHDLAPCPGCGGVLTEHDMSDPFDCSEDAPWWGWYECPRCGWEMPDAKRRWTWGAAAEAFPLVRLLLADLAASRETNARLHRRVQQAEGRREIFAEFAGAKRAYELKRAVLAWEIYSLRTHTERMGKPSSPQIDDLPLHAIAALEEVERLRAEVAKLRAQGVDVWGESAHGEDLDRG